MGRRPDDHEAKKRRLRRSAALLLMDDRLEAATIPNICRNAGLSSTAVHYYFNNRTTLLWEVVAGHMDHLLRQVEVAAPDGAPPLQRLHAMARSYAAVVAQATPEHRTVLAHAHTLPKARHGDARIMQRWMLHAFVTALQAAVPHVPAERATPLALSLLALLNVHSVWFKEGGALRRLDYADMAVRMVLLEAAVTAPVSIP